MLNLNQLMTRRHASVDAAENLSRTCVYSFSISIRRVQRPQMEFQVEIPNERRVPALAFHCLFQIPFGQSHRLGLACAQIKTLNRADADIVIYTNAWYPPKHTHCGLVHCLGGSDLAQVFVNRRNSLAHIDPGGNRAWVVVMLLIGLRIQV
ncbi:hypothetical protein DL89DRAFT_127703 [Linderina pennispora]|uniref:Uncharacterized protein n=1 Tax=Linderina pennispora TaxID=61395 RepID=A0A1Y1WD98_9FUNG|nr:uncharacterized protein DL89DRAFT_127703 [Linderina pennispora]ORX71499.1 hypothetical protein DL89DRAFT_127703 [Linderina pennispora]